MKYIRIENLNLTPKDRQGLLAMLNQLPPTTDKQQLFARQFIKDLCKVKDHPVKTVSAQQFLALL